MWKIMCRSFLSVLHAAVTFQENNKHAHKVDKFMSQYFSGCCVYLLVCVSQKNMIHFPLDQVLEELTTVLLMDIMLQFTLNDNTGTRSHDLFEGIWNV